MKNKILWAGLGLLMASTTANAGFFGHMMTFAAGAVVAHEAEKAIDNHRSQGQTGQTQPNQSQSTNAGGVASDGRYAAVSSQALPDPRRTPGAINPAVTQENLNETICRRGGYTKSIRPPERYTHDLKVKQIREYGYTDTRLYDYEEDHLISLEVGGSPDSPLNLWPEPHHVIGGWGSYAKDKLENKLHSMICKGQISLKQAQYEEATDWVSAYKKYVGPVPNNTKGW